MKKFMFAIFLIAIALASAMAINSSHASGTATISVAPSTQQFPSATVGSTIQINIEISNVKDLWAWDIANLTFNPTVLNLTSVTEGPFLKQAGQDLFIWTSDSAIAFSKGFIPDISDTLLSFTGESGSGVLATLTFQVLSLGTSQILFNQTTLLSPTNLGTISNPEYQSIPDTTINANISVGVTTTSTPTSNPTTAPTTNPSPNASSPSTDSTPSGNSSPTATPISHQAPEFPVFSILIILMIAATVSMLLLAKKAKHNKK